MIPVNKYYMLVFLLSLSVMLTAQGKRIVYDFPVKPGTEKWGDLKTEDERFESMQIPVDLLKDMNTESLIITCINYPAFAHFTAFDNVAGMRHLIKRFNGLQELLARKDAPAKLFSIYLRMDSLTMDVLDSDKEMNKDYWSIKRCYFELLLAQSDIIDNMDNEAQFALLKEARKKLNNKINDRKGEYSLLDIQSTLFVIAQILDRSANADFQKEKNENKGVINFLNTGSIVDEPTIISLMEICDKCITNQSFDFE